MSPLPLGLLIGTAFAAWAVASWFILAALAIALDSRWLFDRIPGSMIAILVIGFLAGVAAAIKRPTRHLGFGMLIGVTVAFPILFMLTFGLLFGLFGGR